MPALGQPPRRVVVVAHLVTGPRGHLRRAVAVVVRPGVLDRHRHQLAAPIPAVDEAVVLQAPARPVVGEGRPVAGDDPPVVAGLERRRSRRGLAHDPLQLVARPVAEAEGLGVAPGRRLAAEEVARPRRREGEPHRPVVAPRPARPPSKQLRPTRGRRQHLAADLGAVGRASPSLPRQPKPQAPHGVVGAAVGPALPADPQVRVPSFHSASGEDPGTCGPAPP